MNDDGQDTDKLKFADIGAGTGYFVSALNRREVNVKGFDVSIPQINWANKFLGKELIFYHKINDLNKVISELDAEVISMIGVLEHLKGSKVLSGDNQK